MKENHLTSVLFLSAHGLQEGSPAAQHFRRAQAHFRNALERQDRAVHGVSAVGSW